MVKQVKKDKRKAKTISAIAKFSTCVLEKIEKEKWKQEVAGRRREKRRRGVSDGPDAASFGAGLGIKKNEK